jgi:hypothetical protein
VVLEPFAAETAAEPDIIEQRDIESFRMPARMQASTAVRYRWCAAPLNKAAVPATRRAW